MLVPPLYVLLVDPVSASVPPPTFTRPALPLIVPEMASCPAATLASIGTEPVIEIGELIVFPPVGSSMLTCRFAPSMPSAVLPVTELPEPLNSISSTTRSLMSIVVELLAGSWTIVPPLSPDVGTPPDDQLAALDQLPLAPAFQTCVAAMA